MTSQIESIRSTEYSPLYEKGIKKGQIKSMETTVNIKLLFETGRYHLINRLIQAYILSIGSTSVWYH